MTTTDPHATCAREGCGHAQDEHSRLSGCTALAGNGPNFCTCVEFQPTNLPVTPYDALTSSGHSGSATSHARALQEDADGTTRKRQETVLKMLDLNAGAGLTVKDLRAETGWHHGQASAALSNLHQAGMIARLTEVRDRCKVYVLPSRVEGRDTEPHGARSAGKRKGSQITLTPAEADALRRMSSRLTNDAARGGTTIHDLGVTFTEDLKAICGALYARDRAPRQS